MQRRRLLPQQMEYSFNEVYEGRPTPIVHKVAVDGGNTFVGTPISRGIATGKVRIVKSMSDAEKLQNGEIMVVKHIDIGWSPYYCMIGGLLTEIGSALSHGAVVAREYGLPVVSCISGATQILKDGDIIQIDGTTGRVTLIS